MTYEPTREQLVGQLAYAIAEGKDIEAESLRRGIAGFGVSPDVRAWPICGHLTTDHATEDDCPVFQAWHFAEVERCEKYGACPSCEYGLDDFGHNHP